MCGIVGLVGVDAPVDEIRSVVHAMVERIHHRGPDGGGLASHRDATLAMKRLAIVDVEAGKQPMLNDDESVVIVFNGEIYNAPSLRSELSARGVQFHTRSDTEVILRLYELDPGDVERHLAGMWAFAIHDRRRRRVVLSRDRFGIKPLFVARSGSAFAFASELRCFERSFAPFSACFELDPSAAHAMLSWGYVPETSTIWKGVERLGPATRLEIDLASGTTRTRRFWECTPSPDAARVRSLAQACESVEGLLRRAVREHLESDVPVATFLSGGIDSALVSALAREESSSPLRAYSIGFAEKRFDESPFARETARLLDVPIDVRMLDEDMARRTVADVLCAYDEPFGDSSSLATYLVCKHVARDYKVVLGGDGGDEVFAGYKKHQAIKLRRPFAHAGRTRDALAKILARVPSRMDRTRAWTEATRTLGRVARALDGTDESSYAALTQVAPLARTAVLMRSATDAAAFLESAEQRFRQASGTALQKTLACDLSGPLPNDMLVKVDRASMAHHLEARVPFLDHRLVEFGIGLPQRYSLGSNGKRVLRAIHERRFGRGLAQRRKQGFGVPVERWLLGPFERACEMLFERSRIDRFGLLSPAALSDGRFRDWARSDPMLLWNAFALASWCEITLGDGSSTLRTLLEGDPKANPTRSDARLTA